jgi:queuosine precursor transporter
MTPALRTLWLPILAMITVVTASNILVQIPINGWLTWGTFSFPFVFLVTDLTNRSYGPQAARRVVYAGFPLAVVLSALFGGVVTDPWFAARVAMASGLAFLVGQLLDILVFERMRRAAWWRAPLFSSVISSAIDTGLFFSLAFAGTMVPWQQLALGDYGVKIAMALVLLAPYKALIGVLMRWQASSARHA